VLANASDKPQRFELPAAESQGWSWTVAFDGDAAAPTGVALDSPVSAACGRVLVGTRAQPK
jgi:hypothetical protein